MLVYSLRLILSYLHTCAQQFTVAGSVASDIVTHATYVSSVSRVLGEHSACLCFVQCLLSRCIRFGVSVCLHGYVLSCLLTSTDRGLYVTSRPRRLSMYISPYILQNTHDAGCTYIELHSKLEVVVVALQYIVGWKPYWNCCPHCICLYQIGCKYLYPVKKELLAFYEV